MKAVSRLSRTRVAEAPFAVKAPVDIVLEHLRQVGPAVASLRNESSRLAGWGEELARRRVAGNRLVTAGSAGSAAEVQQFTAELLGRHSGERRPFSVLALRGAPLAAGAGTASVIEIAQGNAEEAASLVAAHIRADDVLLVVSASGHRHALLDAAAAAKAAGAVVWAVTGRAPNPLAQSADEAVCINALKPQVREAQLIALQAMSECVSSALHTHATRPEAFPGGI